MELSRQEYPALLRSLSPNNAVAVLEQRVKAIGKINTDIADWLAARGSERRRVEESYVQGLRKLAGKYSHGGTADLGYVENPPRPKDTTEGARIFRTPWQSIVDSMDALAQSHSILAQKIEADVERPLKEYQSRNREMQAISTTQGSLLAVTKDLENAQKKAAKLNSGKSTTNKIAHATSDLEAANQGWESQAPYVFEQLQALDESRVNHLRDVLTQLETHEVDQVERNRTAAESCLNTLLNIDTKEEISTFVARQTANALTKPESQRSRNRPGSSGVAALPPPDLPSAVATPSRNRQDDVVRDMSNPYPANSSRTGTVLARQEKSSKGADRRLSPDKQLRTGRNPLRRGPTSRQDMQQIDSPPQSSSSHLPPQAPDPDDPLMRNAAKQPINRPTNPPQAAASINDSTGPAMPALTEVRGAPMANGIQNSDDLTSVQETRTAGERPQAQRDAEGYNLASSGVDDITRAEQEAAASVDTDQNQFKVNIRDAPIHEEDQVAQQTAFSTVANTLRAVSRLYCLGMHPLTSRQQASQVVNHRKPSSNRGRRDVRNTVFVPSGQTLESAGLGGGPPAGFPPPALPSPNTATTPSVPHEAYRGSDAQSVRSAHSMSSTANAVITHPQMHQPGLNASIVETVSATFAHGQVIKAVVIGELALQHVANNTVPASRSQHIRLDNYPVLEKVAPNPTFITQKPSISGEYSVNLSSATRPTVAFKYQVHLDDSSLAAHAPISLTPTWKIEPTQASVILSYAFNAAFVSPPQRRVSLKNVMIFINIESAKVSSCSSKPSGIFSREKSLIYWKLGDFTLDGYAEAPQKLLARFSTESEAKPGNVDVRWEISGEQAAGLGSGLGISQMGVGGKDESSSHDPFADESMSAPTDSEWKEVPLTRKIMSGKYIAISDH
ncbi:MAG: hypothetical protein Q9163_003457 [Psora crenata]